MRICFKRQYLGSCKLLLSKLKDIFFPVTLINTKGYKRTASNTIDATFIQDNKRILISDYAGMGKSTFSKFLTSHIIQEKIAIPIFIELKRLGKENNLLSEIYGQLNHQGNHISIGRFYPEGTIVSVSRGGPLEELSYNSQSRNGKLVRLTDEEERARIQKQFPGIINGRFWVSYFPGTWLFAPSKMRT